MSEEYIKRSDALKAIKHYCQDCNSYNGVMCRACGYGDSIDAVDDVPAADVAPVVHGRWLDNTQFVVDGLAGTGFYPDDETVCCSACHHNYDKIDNCVEEFDFCPFCGSRMDLEEATE